MKKIMIAAAIVCAAVMAQAASIDWGISGKNKLYAQDGTTKWAEQTVYLVLTSQQKGIVEALNAGKFSDSMALGKGVTTTTTAIAGTTTTSDALTRGQSYDFALLMVDTVSVDGQTWYRFSGAATESAYLSGEDDPSVITFMGEEFNSVAWTQAAGPTPVPEPTSGLMLVLGIAGLALRRRRA